jgi:hypothetical protein
MCSLSRRAGLVSNTYCVLAALYKVNTKCGCAAATRGVGDGQGVAQLFTVLTRCPYAMINIKATQHHSAAPSYYAWPVCTTT